MFKKNPYIFSKELINNSFSEDLSESVMRLALSWTQEKDYKNIDFIMQQSQF